MAALLSPTDVHNCRSLTCIACNHSGSVLFVKADVSNKILCKPKLAINEQTSQASTAPSSPSPSSSQKTLTPPSTISRKRVIFENISSVGVICAFSSNPNLTMKDDDSNDFKVKLPYNFNVRTEDAKLNVPYKLTRARSMDSLDRFVASIESARACEEEDDVDQLIFGTPWKNKL